MSKLEMIHPAAIQQTKQKIVQDIDRFLEEHENVPSYQDYIDQRKVYVEQIWRNVWLNKASNDVPKKEKKAFLKEKGYVTEGVDKKIINKLFRDEIRDYKPFDAVGWVEKRYSGDEADWETQYRRARKGYFKRQQEAKQAEERIALHLKLQEYFNGYVNKNFSLLYLYVRHFVSRQIKADFQDKTRYEYIDPNRLEERLLELGNFNRNDYSLVAEFFEELTGGVQTTFDWGKRHFEYETYYDLYERKVIEYIFGSMPDLLMEGIPGDLNDIYLDTAGEHLTKQHFSDAFDQNIIDVAIELFQELQDEYLDDLLSLAIIPFDPAVHKEIFEKDVADRERRKAEEQAEIERKMAEEARIIEDIFGRAYTPSLGMDVRYVLHIGETNTGKTHHALQKMKEADSGLYLAPLRLLALEVYDRLNGDNVPCTLKTGEEEKIVTGAKHISSTVEMFHEKDFYEVVVIDEAQMIADKDRGFSWYKAIMKANAREVHIIGSRNSKMMLLDLLEGAEIELKEYSRDIPLEVEHREFSLKYTKKGDALICFSRKQVLETASKLKRSGHTVSMIYGSMPPETRKRQIELFNQGQTTVVVATDAIGMGLNLPIRRIVFLETEKFDGTRRRRLTSQEVKQIAGRAGRKGIYDIGKVAFAKDIKIMSRLLEQQDEPIQTFAIAPTSAVFERFQRHYRHLGTFFELWEKFLPPKGTKKASLSEERELYELIRDSDIEARFSMMDLYGFLHLPFSSKEPALIRQWLETMMAIADGRELPEPVIKRKNLEDFELSYKAIGLHLLFLYRLGKKTEAIYWERAREEISLEVHHHLRDEVENYRKKCKRCGKPLPDRSEFPICDSCYQAKYRKGNRRHERWA